MRETKGILQSKLDEFIRKYYLNRLVQGFLLGFGGLLAFVLIASLSEYYGHFGTTVRTGLFFIFILFFTGVLIGFILIPLLKRWNLSSTISYHEASEKIGKYFPEIRDKLLNTLQLQEQVGKEENELLLASIDQRIRTLSPFRFSTAVDVRASARTYGKYTILPLCLLLIILIFQSNIITKPAERILSYNQQFVKEAPFTFNIQNKELTVFKNSDFTIEVQLTGSQIPGTVYIRMDGHTIKMENKGRNLFSHPLYNLTSDHNFVFTDGEYESLPFQVKVLPNPVMTGFTVNLSYPSYIHKKNEVLKNIGDFTVPEGTKVEWIIQASDAERLVFNINGNEIQAKAKDNSFTVGESIRKSSLYFLSLQNKLVSRKDTVKYSIQVLPDRHPGIMAEQTQDSINPYRYYFYGKADDDYGISRLQFVYRSIRNQSVQKFLPVQIGKGTDEIFYYMVDLKALTDIDGEEFEYYFEVWDNDAVNGKKSSKSQIFRAILPTAQELKAESESSSAAVKNKISETMKEIQNLQKKSSELNKDLTESDQLDWMKEQKLKDFIAEQKKLEKRIEELKQENRIQNEKQKQINPLEQELLEKQKELEKLFNEIMTPEMKELLKKLEETIKQQNKDAIQQQLEKLNKSNEDMKKQLDRTLEQYKQLELEKRINEEVDALKKLSAEQAELAKKTQEKSLSKEELQKQQDAINKKFEELKNDIKQTEEKNKQLETPMNLDDLKSNQEAIDNDLKNSSESLDKKQNKKASESQKKAADEMEEMAEKMKKSLEKSQEEQAEEDYYTLRQILENLIELSVQEEHLMTAMREIKSYSPKFVELSSLQRKLKENTKMVEDSLLALSKRQIHIKSFVNKEIGNINYNMDESLEYFSKVHIQSGVVRQQYVMTGLNNLAVMLSESLKQMQENMKENKNKSNSQCKNPGKKPGKPGQSGKPKMSGIKQMQDEISKQLQEMKNGKQEGKTPGSEQFAKLAAKQEALRREVERLQKMLKEEGTPGALGDLEKTKQLMEQMERDLVNKQLSPETMRRMKEIETRMFEHEKAEREQKTDNQREAEQAKTVEHDMPASMKAYLEKKAREMELLRSVPNELSPYYKDRVRVYFQKLGNL